MDRCYSCHTEDFTDGIFTDISTPADEFQGATNAFCLSCAAKYEQQGIATFEAMQTIEQLATETEWAANGIGIN